MIVATLQVPATVWLSADEDVVIAYVESQIASAEFDILVLPQWASHLRPHQERPDDLLTRQKTLRYWISLSGRKHALVVAGAAEKVRPRSGPDRYFLTTLAAFEGELVARYAKVHLEVHEAVHFNRGSHYRCHVDLPFFTVAVTSGSELRNAQSTAAFDAPFVPIALVSSAVADTSMAQHARLIARQFGLYAVFSNVVGDYRANGKAINFSGQSAIYTRYGEVLGRMDDESGIGFAEVPDIPTRLEGLGNIHFGVKRSTLRTHRWLVRNDTLTKDGFADLV